MVPTKERRGKNIPKKKKIGFIYVRGLESREPTYHTEAAAYLYLLLKFHKLFIFMFILLKKWILENKIIIWQVIF